MRINIDDIKTLQTQSKPGYQREYVECNCPPEKREKLKRELQKYATDIEFLNEGQGRQKL